MPDLLGRHCWRAPDALSAGACGRNALVRALHDQFAAQLRERGEDMEDQTTARGGLQAAPALGDPQSRMIRLPAFAYTCVRPWVALLLVQLSVVVPLVVTVFVAATGYAATYLTNLRLARRKDHLDRVNRQLSELYGPLYAQSEAVDRAWRKFFVAGGGNVWTALAPVTTEQAATWRLWMSTVFMPLNRRMVETVVSHADLLREDTIPEPLKELCAHVACYEPIVARWQEDGFDSVQVDDHVSIAGNFPRRELDDYLRNSFESLKLEQARLLAQIQRLR
ncbi:hypothetical protein ACGF4C_20240 [Streptomyces sp. NPDC048197]|uniref:hypothetical protein n=1 Tax=Streptomyces sp. NPDC048197 TaxID=3365511 RepID=UPI0037128F5C